VKDFLKIFLVLCAVVGAFFFGRNYGEETKVESSEFKTLKSDNFNNNNAQEELANLKEKFQKLLDSSDLKKADDILGKIMTIFLADLSLQLTENQQKDIEIGKQACVMKLPEPQVTVKTDHKPEIKSDPKHEEEEPVVETKKSGIRNEGKFKAAEFEILEAQSAEDMARALKNLELKKIDSLLEGAPNSSFQQSKKFFGTYRGTILDSTGKIYGTMILDVKNTPAAKSPITGSFKLFKDGKESVGSDFSTDSLGYSPEKFGATVIQMGSRGYIQVYKAESIQKIAGIYYERLPNGTSKTIGTFILSRTDFVD
jgi:hypothetical protein